MKKYLVVVFEKSGKSHKIEADRITFNDKKGGVDIFIDSDGIPVMPCREEEVHKFDIYIVN